jgi:epoxyqueuosine reductase
MSFNQIQVESIKAEAANLGFSLIGFSDSSSLQQTHRYKDWLHRGFNASMGYLSRPDSLSKRFNPNLLVKGCCTVLSLGFSYPLIDFHKFPGSTTGGWISSYAIMEDYHDTLKGLAEQLSTRIQKMIGGNYTFRVFTDSTPILEREFGVLGNLGWIGKNANLISPTVGSHFLLAEILTNLEMKPEEMTIKDRCGKCHHCMDACPTHCIQADRTIDSRKCISYLTIENKEGIPIELRENFGQWVFGCDICQTVCPWNQHLQRNGEIQQAYRISPVIDLAKQLNFSENEFANYYSGTPVLRAGWLGFTRNLIIAAGNMQDEESMSPLIKLLKDHPLPYIRSHAAWALGKLQVANAHQQLKKGLLSERDPKVIAEIQSAII